MKLRILSLLLLMLAVSLTACVGGQRNYSGSGSGTQGETLNQQVARHDQQIQGILSQVGQVEQVLPGQAEMWSQMQTMRQEVNSMHGQIDDLNNQLSGSNGRSARTWSMCRAIFAARPGRQAQTEGAT